MKTQQYCPYKFKYELVYWLYKYQGWKHYEANKLSKKQLLAIYYSKSE